MKKNMKRLTIASPAVGDIFRPGHGHRTATTRGPRILLLLHDECGRCRTWVRHELGAVADDLRRWGAHVVPLGSDFSAEDPKAAWLAVVDEWDEAFHVALVGSDHAFPDPVDLVEWVRFVAIQCPECEAPEGPWRR